MEYNYGGNNLMKIILILLFITSCGNTEINSSENYICYDVDNVAYLVNPTDSVVYMTAKDESKCDNKKLK